MDKDHYIPTRKYARKKPLVTKVPKVNDDELQPGGVLSQINNNYKPYLSKPVKFLGVACQLCIWSSGEKVILQIQNFILCNVKRFVKHFALFHMIQTLAEYKKTVTS